MILHEDVCVVGIELKLPAVQDTVGILKSLLETRMVDVDQLMIVILFIRHPEQGIDKKAFCSVLCCPSQITLNRWQDVGGIFEIVIDFLQYIQISRSHRQVLKILEIIQR